MTPRPLYRWKSFWLGILVIISLVWAWGSSMDRLSAVQVNTPSVGWIALGQCNGEVGLFHESVKIGSWDFMAFDETATIGSFHEENWRRLAAVGEIILLSHAHLIIAFLLTWSTFLLWRWRKAKALTAPSH